MRLISQDFSIANETKSRAAYPLLCAAGAPMFHAVTVLTPAEVEVARLAGAGVTNAQIARLRQVSTHTVAKQMSSVLGKLGVCSRTALATLPELSMAADDPRVDWRALTGTERSVLDRARAGRPQKQIAFECGLAPSTVSRAMNAARRRLGFDSVAGLLRAWSRA
jgi:DNA-binding CsgD family transcriptional regulator